MIGRRRRQPQKEFSASPSRALLRRLLWYHGMCSKVIVITTKAKGRQTDERIDGQTDTM